VAASVGDDTDYSSSFDSQEVAVGKLIYSMITSLDGYVSDPDGNFGWGAPAEESHEFINENTRSVGTHLYGRRMYETMVYWETAHSVSDQPSFVLACARIWQAADKIIYSTTMKERYGVQGGAS
jgi:dihydrofolate reductase